MLFECPRKFIPLTIKGQKFSVTLAATLVTEVGIPGSMASARAQ